MLSRTGNVPRLLTASKVYNVLNQVYATSMESFSKKIPIISVFLFGSALRFYNLGEIPGPVFDEVFYPLWGLNYLTGEQFFSVHPPLGNYLFTLSISLFHLLPGTGELGTSFDQLNPLSYRWLNATVGSLLILIAYFVALRIYNKTVLALLVALFFAIDGSMLVDSRFGLINIYLAFFGGVSLLFFLKSIQDKDHKILNMILCGVFLGLAISIKWNGLGYWLTIVMFSFLPYLWKATEGNADTFPIVARNITAPNQGLTRNIGFVLSISLVAMTSYLLIWLPDLAFHDDFDLVDKHSQIASYHLDRPEEKLHPYSSSWRTWPFMSRPVGYYFSSVDVLTEEGINTTYFTDVHLFPNPVIYWLSALSILVLSFHWMYCLRNFLLQRIYDKIFLPLSFILIGFFGNFLPWALVSRSTFLYHYQPASGFSFMALALCLYSLREKNQPQFKILYGSLLFIIVVAFLYWLPLQLGLEIERESFYQRMWFGSWI